MTTSNISISIFIHSSECRSDCYDKGGEWDYFYEVCRVVKYLNNLCFRVSDITGSWQMDQPAYVSCYRILIVVLGLLAVKVLVATTRMTSILLLTLLPLFL